MTRSMSVSAKRLCAELLILNAQKPLPLALMCIFTRVGMTACCCHQFDRFAAASAARTQTCL